MLFVRERGEAGGICASGTASDAVVCETLPMVPKLRKRSSEGERRAMLGEACVFVLCTAAWLGLRSRDT